MVIVINHHRLLHVLYLILGASESYVGGQGEAEMPMWVFLALRRVNYHDETTNWSLFKNK